MRLSRTAEERIQASSAARGAMGFKDDGEGQDLNCQHPKMMFVGVSLASGYVEDAKSGTQSGHREAKNLRSF